MTSSAIANSVLEAIGHTPIVRLNRVVPKDAASIYAKVESFNPMGSVKDRIAKGMLEDAERRGHIAKGVTIVEPTSGNTGIGLAMVCAVKGYRLMLTMPDTMTLERRRLLAAFGAEVVLTPGERGMKGAIEMAEELAKSTKDAVMLRQFINPANPETHARTTAMEICDVFESLDAFIAGVGTGGTLTGVGRVLKEKYPSVRLVAVEPADSPVLSGGMPGKHEIHGIGAGFVPEVLDTSIVDMIVKVSLEDAKRTTRLLAKKEGLLVGISSGAAVHAAIGTANEIGQGKSVLVILPDTGERYLSTDLFGE